MDRKHRGCMGSNPQPGNRFEKSSSVSACAKAQHYVDTVQQMQPPSPPFCALHAHGHAEANLRFGSKYAQHVKVMGISQKAQRKPHAHPQRRNGFIVPGHHKSHPRKHTQCHTRMHTCTRAHAHTHALHGHECTHTCTHPHTPPHKDIEK
jgi:hypothetical protein